MDRPDIRGRALADPVSFLEDASPPVILDEVQHAPHLLAWIKNRVDEDRRPGSWVLTGSQKFPLMRDVGETLAGRIAVLELDTLSVGEWRGQDPPGSVDELLERVFTGTAGTVPGVDMADWLLRGSYPEPRLKPDVDRRLWMAGYIQTYLERDVRDLLQVGDLRVFSSFLTMVAARTGTILNMASLGRELGVSGPTVRRWLSVLETSNVVHLMPPYHRNLGKRIRKSPKLHVLDPGLVTFMTGLHTPEAVKQGPTFGALVETAVVAEWLKAVHATGEAPGMYYWRTSSGQEVDLIIEHGGTLHGIKVKATSTPNLRHAGSLVTWMSLVPGARGALACRVTEPFSLGKGVRAVPWHLGWSSRR